MKDFDATEILDLSTLPYELQKEILGQPIADMPREGDTKRHVGRCRITAVDFKNRTITVEAETP